LQARELSLGSLDLREKNPAVGRDSNKVGDTVLVGLDELDDIVALIL